MRDISRKTSTLRAATAEAVVTMRAETLERIRRNEVPKGNPLEVARVAGIQAAKNTSQIIPYCHPLLVEHVEVGFKLGETAITVTVSVKAVYKTGVEMEALTGASVAALTLYDMLKMLDSSMQIGSIRLVEKHGGKSDHPQQRDASLRAAVLVLSDSVSKGQKQDVSGKLIEQRLQNEGFSVVDYKVVSDDQNNIEEALLHYADSAKIDLVITTGGTGLGPRDNAPEAMRAVIERNIPGIPEVLRAYGQNRTPNSMLSRGMAGVRGGTIIVNLPGSTDGASESLDALFPGLHHVFDMLRGGNHTKDVRKTES